MKYSHSWEYLSSSLNEYLKIFQFSLDQLNFVHVPVAFTLSYILYLISGYVCHPAQDFHDEYSALFLDIVAMFSCDSVTPLIGRLQHLGLLSNFTISCESNLHLPAAHAFNYFFSCTSSLDFFKSAISSFKSLIFI